jgi:hypothetical protein
MLRSRLVFGRGACQKMSSPRDKDRLAPRAGPRLCRNADHLKRNTQDARAIRSAYLGPRHGGPLSQGQSPRRCRDLAPLHCWRTNRKNIPTAINTAIRIPTTSEATQCRRLVGFDPAPLCAAPMPNQNRSLSTTVSAAALWQYAYDYGGLPHSAGAKSPNPGQGYLARRHHER